ncbi:PREDICTED: uncharacterized protein LOC106101421 isoform X2 [Papilio polytes]|uniref:uncharacterized protein LOC106101421 isoform X2 n=1 Tax=Papilio polytes TaxID=76194 RepID=UPI00067679B5|nr:PREDICTED: uncharacterized protein LOC106101421 isoform X2 [Papilio polytes]
MYQDESSTLTYTVRGEGSPGPRPSGKASASHLNSKPAVPEDDQDWFREQYERKIGTPVSCASQDINVILRNIIYKMKSPKESAEYSEPVIPKTEAKLLKWPDMANIKKCLCKDFGCICRGCKLSEAVSIPYASSSNKEPAGTFLGSLEVALIEATESYMLLLGDDRTMCLKCPEFCASRCMSFKFETPDQVPSRTEHLEEKLRLDEYSYTLKKRRMRRIAKYQQQLAKDIEEGDKERDECKDEPKINLSNFKFGSKIFKKKDKDGEP